MRSTRPLVAGLLLVTAWARCSINENDIPCTGDQNCQPGWYCGAGLCRPNAAGSDGSSGLLEVEPSALQTLTVNTLATTPTVVYTARYAGAAVSATWTLDPNPAGSLSAGSGSTVTFMPTGTGGGLATLHASYGGSTATRQVMVKLTGSQNGETTAELPQVATSASQLTTGGGIGGVGGEGLGPAVTDGPTLTALGSPADSGASANLAFLYPYDHTVWPLGIQAPLLMWSWASGDADAVQISLSTASGSFSWTGTFGRPGVLTATGGHFIRHPIPDDVWQWATASAAAVTQSGTPDTLTVSLTVAKAGVGHGPIRETWPVAPARLPGTIYYDSYDTALAAPSLCCTYGTGQPFAGAVLQLTPGQASPTLLAGAPVSAGTQSATGCRSCHSGAANGSALIAQHGDGYMISSDYLLTKTGFTEQILPNGSEFPAVFPDGSKMLTEMGQLLPLPTAATPLPITGLTTITSDLGTPSFSPDGSHIVFNPMAGPGITDPTMELDVMSFDEAIGAFSAPLRIVDDSCDPAGTRPGWPSFLPDGRSVVFQQQSMAGFDGNTLPALSTRKGALAQIDWASASATTSSPLDELNGNAGGGRPYLPQLATAVSLTCTADGVDMSTTDAKHADDVDHNYEPYPSPASAGGYVWIAFTSRRMYGSVLTSPPFCSDARGVDLNTYLPTKKVWIAAVDAQGTPAADASHPAFYLPAQELGADNFRPVWISSP
jgi:hypothetical protein